MDHKSLEGFRLSPQQRRAWLFGQRSSCLAIGCLHVDGRLDAGRLRDAVRGVIEQHEILRTTFHRQPGMRVPLQVIAEQQSPAWCDIDLRQLDRQAQEAEIDSRVRQERRREFDLETGPLLRVTCAALSDDRHLLVLSLPALCCDNWTLANMGAEISRYYGVPSSEAAVEPVQYRHFSEWQNQMVETEDAEREAGRAYWRKSDWAVIPPPSLPFARSAAGDRRFEPEAVPLTLPPGVAAKIRAAADRQDVQFSHFLLACWAILLWRLTGQTELTIGSVCDGRKFEELHEALGLFTQTTPLTCRFDERLSFREILAKVHQSEREVYDWQDYFAGEELEDRTFPVSFEFDERPFRYTADGLSFVLEDRRTITEPFTVKLAGFLIDAGLRLQFEYDPQLIDRQEVQRIAEQYQTILSAALDEPLAPAGGLRILPDRQRRQLLVDWSRTEENPAPYPCLHHWFEAQVERVPEQPAVVFEGEQLTYSQLDARANQLAHELRKLGVGPEILVGICVERSLAMIVGILGVLKAGGAYVPLDPALPRERLAFMVADSGAPVLLTQASLAPALGELSAQLLCLDTEGDSLPPAGAPPPVPGVQAENPAYVIYTSGSTGRPKGVCVEHRALVNYVQATITRLQLPAGAHFATVSTFAADLGHTAIFPSLCTGGCLHVIAAERAADPEALAEYFSRQPINFLKIVPSHLSALLACSRPEQIIPRGWLVLGGEAANWELVEKVRRLRPDCRVDHHYGPTETTVGVLTHRVAKDPHEPPSTRLPLGRPLPGLRVFVLDRHGEPAPIGTAGEVYVGGAGLARGYWRQPALTAARFVPDPFSAEPGARLYRTGDLARYRPDGNLEFLGRSDHQIKLRGFRIELEEIEATLRRHPAIQETAVVAREDAPGELRIVAYLVPRADSAASNGWREFLREHLPDFMIPAAFVPLESLPLTRNGKLDRRALPPPEQAGPQKEDESDRPPTPVESVLAEIWEEVLGQEHVSRHASFFDLGGHSLLATQVVARVRQAFQVPLTLPMLFAAPTAAGLAARVEAALREAQGWRLPPLQPVPRDQALPLSFAQQRLYFIHRLEPESALYNVPRALRMSGPLNVVALQQTLETVVTRHEALRTTFVMSEEGPLQVIGGPAPVPLPVIDLSDRPEAEREAEARRQAEEEARRPFDLERGPLFRARLLQLGRQEHVLLLTLHHIVSDGWSAGVLSREIAAIYAAFQQGRPSPLPALPIQYADYAVWQRQWLQGEVLEAQIAYWKRQLMGAPTLLELPTDRPREAAAGYEGASFSFRLPEALTSELAQLGRQEGATLFMTLLAAFQVLLHRCTRQTEIVVGTDVANRGRVELEGLIGFFLNHLVLRCSLKGNPTFRELLGQVKEVALGAYAHQDLPFEKLVEVLNPERSTGHTPLFQVLFVLQNVPRAVLTLTELTLESMPVRHESSKFDLSLFMMETTAGLNGLWLYRTALFDSQTIERMSGQLTTLLGSIVAEPDTPVSALEIRTAEEKEERHAEDQLRQEAQAGRLRRARRRTIDLVESEAER